jgi:hypothetical protein
VRQQIWTPPFRRAFWIFAALLSIVALTVSAVSIIIRVDAYDAETFHLRTGQPITVTLSSGHYGAFVGCADYVGCPQISGRRLSVYGVVSGAISLVEAGNIDDMRRENGQEAVREWSFKIPVRQAVRIELSSKLLEPVFIAPAEEEIHSLRVWITAEIVSLISLLGSIVILAWPFARRAR